MITPAAVGVAHLDLADRLAPGLIEALYLEGSVALGDYRPGVSDIDFVAVTSRPAGADEVRALHAALRKRHPKPHFDGLYLGRGDLAGPPGSAPPGPSVHEGRVAVTPRSAADALVTWHVLAQSPVALRGPERPEVWTDWPAVAAGTERNLTEYWQPWLRTARGPVGLGGWAVSWGVLGVARLRHTLEAGRITTKTEAAGYALRRYDDRRHRVIREALRLRAGGPAQYRNPLRRRADLVGFLETALES